MYNYIRFYKQPIDKDSAVVSEQNVNISNFIM